MHKMLKMFGVSVLSLGAVMTVMAANAAENTGRAAYNSVRAGASSARMPTMPTLPPVVTGNISVDVPNVPSAPVVTPNPQPDNPQPDDPQPDNPQPKPECSDGGVMNSAYTIDMCMNDVLHCVNGGALPNGLNAMFNEDLRNAIVNGMGLCVSQVDKCIADVRQDCRNVYRAPSDVWLDFNSRKVQPEYYSFILRKTGLTPNQAENTCLLLDRNTYGSSFTAVSNSGKVTSEYNNTVGAYNSQQGNVLVKNKPQGLEVNTDGLVDGSRGHYARWDATTGECLIRVAAYNKDEVISNNWLFGAVGNDEPAEVWKPAGETFKCDKDLFGFSLMNDTKTAAVVGVGGGTLLGAGVGAIAGHGAREFDCTNATQRKTLGQQLRSGGFVGTLNQFLDAQYRISTTGGDITPEQCAAIVNVATLYDEYSASLNECDSVNAQIEEVEIALTCSGYTSMDKCFQDTEIARPCVGQGFTTPQQCVEYLSDLMLADAGVVGGCMFKPINIAKMSGTGIYCDAASGCRTPDEMWQEIKSLGNVIAGTPVLKGEESNMGKSIAVGAAVGAGTGGVATAITAFVERNNISCRVGDGLARVGLGKAYSIGNLRDFYVKWNLQLPDTVSPTALVTDCESWKNTCITFKNLNDCKAAQINYKPAGAKKAELVPSACTVSGSVCVENYPVSKSYGACE